MPDSRSYVEKTNELANEALEQAKLILRYGPSQQKIQVIRSVLGVLAKQAAAGQDAGAAVMRSHMEELMREMRNVPELDVIVTDQDILDVEVIEEADVTHIK